MLPNLDGEAAARAERRLYEQTIAWLTTVSPEGQPQTSPIGYVWDGTAFLVLSEPDALKVRNLRANPKVALHLDTDTGATEGLGVLTIEGVATLEPAPPGGSAPLSTDEADTYVARHRENLESADFTPEQAFAFFSTIIRITPTRTRSY